MVRTTSRSLRFGEAEALVREGACYVDLRPIDLYLEVHIPGSLALLYESGPGMASRARDCLPLDRPLVLLEASGTDMANAAAALRGKGFTVLGEVSDGVNSWAGEHGVPASTEVWQETAPPDGCLLDVSDPGARVEPHEARRIPIEHLWSRAAELAEEPRVVVAFGYGVRAGLAVGMLELAGVSEVVAWRLEARPQTRRLEPYG